MKPNKLFVFLLVFLFFIFFVLSCSLKFPFGKTYTGTYLCNKNECTLSSVLLVKDVQNLKTKNKLFIDKQPVDLKIKTFKNVVYNETIPVQEVVFLVPKFDFFNHQIISYTLDLPMKNIWQILWENWKGGEDLF